MVPDADILPAYAKSELGLDLTELSELCQNTVVQGAVMDAMAKVAKLYKLNGFEQVKPLTPFAMV